MFVNLWLRFVIERSLMYYVFQAFAPSILLMVLNFSSYWIPDQAVPARIALIVTTFLTSTFILQSATESIVRISYVSPMQLFLVVHVFFIVVSIIEYIFVLTIFPKVTIVRNHEFSTYVKIFKKTNISYHVLCIRRRASQEVRNVSFSKKIV